jgi:hypothetical protein
MGLFAPPVREFDGRASLRSLADALEKLRELDGFSEGDTVELKTYPLELFDGRRTGPVSVLRPARSGRPPFVVLMPSSGEFTALTTIGERLTYAIGELHDAVSDAAGNVELANGCLLHGVTLKPVPFYEFSATEDKIVRLALKFLGAEASCYRPLEPNLLPKVEVLDYALVARIHIERLKPVQQYVLKCLPALSPSAVSSALKRAGIRLPRSRT